MNTYAARRAESEGAASGFNLAVGYLQSAVEGGRAVDPAKLLALITAQAERIAAIWRDPTDEHSAAGGSDRGVGAPGAGGAAGGGSDSAGHPRPAVIDPQAIVRALSELERRHDHLVDC